MQGSNLIKKLLIVGVTLGVINVYTANAVFAENEGKITICHAAGQDGTTHYVTLTLSRNAVYQDQGNGGHFYENGTTKAGHENDYIGECRNTSSSPTPTPTPTVAPSTTPSTSPTATPTANPTTSPNSSSNNSSSNTTNNTNVNSDNQKEGEVLGAYAATGVADDVMMNASGIIGSLMTAVGAVSYGKKSKKR